jgi:hypothetical protein
MPYNEWYAALWASLGYCYTDNRAHLRLRAYFSNPQGQLLTDWSTLTSTISSLTSRLQWGNYAAAEILYSNINTRWGATGNSAANYSLVINLGEVNNPYQIADYYNNYVLGRLNFTNTHYTCHSYA